MRVRRAAAVLGLSALACARSTPSETQPGPASAARAVDSAGGRRATDPELVDLGAAVGVSSSWVEAVRMHRWAEAAKLIDALAPDERKRPGVRYVRARVAAALADHARARSELTNLEQALPLLSSEIARDRAKAELEVGPFESAAKYYAARGDAESLLLSALALERGGQAKPARATLERALALIRREKNEDKRTTLESRARSARARLAEAAGQSALAAADLRWIATHAPGSSEADQADVRLAKLSPKLALTRKERIDRAWALADQGHVDKTERELGLIESLPGPAVAKSDLLRTRGWALYVSRTDYAQASDLLERAARLGSRDPARDLFYAARARSRAHDDDRAIQIYDDIARRYGSSYWGEQARYLSARLKYIKGRWAAAASAYDAYLKRHGKNGRNASSARHEQAVAWLAGGQYARAKSALAKLADDAKSEQDEALYLELAGVAEAKAGNSKQAAATLRKVIEHAPLSFAALAAAARLEQMKETVPPPIAPAATTPAPPPLDVKLPPKVRLLVQLGLDDDAEDVLAAHEEAIAKAHAPRSGEALCEAYSTLASAARRYRAGQRAARWSLLTTAPDARTRWLWECIYPRPYEPLVREAEREHELPPNLVYAVMRQESAFRASVVSPAQAVGLLQLIPPTAQKVAGELGVDYDPLLLESPPHNIRMGAYYLKKVLSTFGGNVALGAAAYNAGPAAVSRWLVSGEALPLDVFVARIPYGETRGYVTRVIGNLARYAYLQGGADAVPKLALEIDKGLRAPADAY